MPTQAATAGKQLIDRINELAGTPRLDEFALRRVERDAEKLLAADEMNARIVLGAAACLRRDWRGMHAHHRRAIEQGGGGLACYQYAVSLTRAGLLADALSLAEQGIAETPSYRPLLESAIGLALNLGFKEKARVFLEKWRKLSPGEPPYVSEEEIEAYHGQLRPNVSGMIEDMLAERRDVWAALAKL